MTMPTTAGAANTRMIAAGVEMSVQLVRRLLLKAGLSVVDEFDMSGEPCVRFGAARRSCVVLLVDTPELLFGSIALDRAAAVFVPIHVVIGGDDDTSYVYWANPMATSGLRPAAPARAPLQKLCGCIAEALSRLPEPSDMTSQGGRK